MILNPANAVTAEATSKALKEAAAVLGLELLFFKGYVTAGEVADHWLLGPEHAFDR